MPPGLACRQTVEPLFLFFLRTHTHTSTLISSTCTLTPSPTLDPLSFSPSEDGDQERLEIPQEAMDEIKQADKGKVYEMSKEPYW